MEKFTIQNRYGLQIVGNVTLPENPIGLSFIVHGLGGYKEEVQIQLLAKVLLEQGYIVVLYDGTNSKGESGGKFEEATMQKHYEDLLDVHAWAKTQDWYREPFLLTGHSMGGYAVARFAQEFPDQVKAVFPCSAVFSGKDSLETYQRLRSDELREWQETGWIQRFSKTKPDFVLRLPWSHMQERQLHDLKPAANKITMPILFVVGENDTSCTPADQKKFFDLVPDTTPKEFHVIDGAEHVFREEVHLNQLKDILLGWLSKL